MAVPLTRSPLTTNRPHKPIRKDAHCVDRW